MFRMHLCHELPADIFSMCHHVFLEIKSDKSVCHAMRHLLSITRALAKKGLIEKYKKTRLANYNLGSERSSFLLMCYYIQVRRQYRPLFQISFSPIFTYFGPPQKIYSHNSPYFLQQLKQ